MSYIEMTKEEIHDLVERGGLDDGMFFSLYEEAKKMSYVLYELENYAKLCEALKERWSDREIVEIKKQIGLF